MNIGISVKFINVVCFSAFVAVTLIVHGQKLLDLVPTYLSLFDNYGEEIWRMLAKVFLPFNTIMFVAKLATGSCIRYL